MATRDAETRPAPAPASALPYYRVIHVDEPDGLRAIERIESLMRAGGQTPRVSGEDEAHSAELLGDTEIGR